MLVSLFDTVHHCLCIYTRTDVQMKTLQPGKYSFWMESHAVTQFLYMVKQLRKFIFTYYLYYFILFIIIDYFYLLQLNWKFWHPKRRFSVWLILDQTFWCNVIFRQNVKGHTPNRSLICEWRKKFRDTGSFLHQTRFGYVSTLGLSDPQVLTLS
jgi:hypothetical protein